MNSDMMVTTTLPKGMTLADYIRARGTLVETAKMLQKKTEDQLWNIDEEIKDRLKRGESTGNKSRDEAMLMFPGHDEMIERYVAFNDRLVRSRGEYMLILAHYKVQTCFSSDPECNEYSDAHGYIFGLLSGDRMQVGPRGSRLVFPFIRHYAGGFNWIASCGLRAGNWEYTDSSYNPSFFTLLSAIVGDGMSIQTLSESATIWIGNEITEEVLLRETCPVSLEALKSSLCPKPQKFERIYT